MTHRNLEAQAPTPPEELDRAIAILGEHKREFARAHPTQKADLLAVVLKRFHELSPAMVRAGCEAKGIAYDSELAGEEWFSGPVVTLRNLRLLIDSLQQIAENGVPRIAPNKVRPLEGGGTRISALPWDAFDRVLFTVYEGETWLEVSSTPSRIGEYQASFYKESAPEGRVAVVLGAGNVASIPAMDVLYKMFVEGAVCILKMSPVNAYLGPWFERAFEPLIARNFLRIVYGGKEVGEHLCNHPQIDELHMTGSLETHDTIVWGPPGTEREARKQRGEPRLAKKVTSELGNISPVMVVPGKYSDSELDSMARNIAGMVAHNASFNCNAAKLLVLPKGFAAAETLIRRLGAVLSSIPPRQAYYPGALERYRRLTTASAHVQRFGPEREGALPWTLIRGLDPEFEHPHFSTEPFCSILSVVTLGSSDPLEFLDAATRFVNDKLWGTLSAMLFASSVIETDRTVERALSRTIRALRYGTVCVNVWPGVAYGFGSLPWGGHPSATLANVQSGIGWVHNTPMLERIEKTVLRAPIKILPKAPYFPGHRTLATLGRRMADFYLDPSARRIPKIAFAAVRG